MLYFFRLMSWLCQMKELLDLGEVFLFKVKNSKDPKCVLDQK